MRQCIIGAVSVAVAGLVNTLSWAQAQQAGVLSEKSTVTIGFAIGIGSLVLSAAGAFVGGRIALVRIEQKLTDHSDTQKTDLVVLASRITEMEHVHRDCPARKLRGD